ncbi:MAG: hypothetical protein Kapaf2KO_13070 [Candidatus Kapaibacteriales bacterium]
MTKIFVLSLILSLLSINILSQNALNFDGIDDFVSIADNDALDLLADDDMTIEFWFKTTSNESFVPLIAKTDVFNGQTGYAVSMYEGIIGIAKIAGGIDISAAQINTVAKYNDGKWHHFTAVMPGIDANDYSIYIDESKQATTLIYNNFSGEMVNNITLKLGYFGTNNFFKGTMDEVRIWSKALNESEIIAFSETELSGNEVDLVAYYNFNQGEAYKANLSELILKDRTLKQLHGNLRNFGLLDSLSNWVEGVNFTTTKVEHSHNEDLISAYPNPSISFISFDNIKGVQNFSIYDCLGQLISWGTISSNKKIDISNYSNGFYTLVFDNGKSIRFIKE